MPVDELRSRRACRGGRAARRGARLRAPERGTRPARKFLGRRGRRKPRVLAPMAFFPGRRSARGPEPRRGGGRCALARTAGHPRRESQMAERSVLRGTQARRNIDRRIGRPATDIASHSDAVPSRTALLVALLGSVAAALAQFSREGFAPFREEWLRRHAWRGRRVALSQAERRVAEGRIVGVAEDGALMLSSAKGIERFHSGELSLKAL